MSHLDLSALPLHLSVDNTSYTLLRLGPSSAIPTPLVELLSSPGSRFIAVTRTRWELSIVYPMGLYTHTMAVGDEVEGPWRMVRVQGPMELHMTGVLHKLSTPLAEAGVAIFALSTFDTDHILVHEADQDKARHALEQDGWQFIVVPPAKNFVDLPAEIQLQVLSYVDFPTLASFRCVSQATQAVVNEGSEQVYCDLSHSHGFTREKTYSASSLRSTMDEKAKRAAEGPSHRRGLARAIEVQHSLDYFLGTPTWKMFAHKQVVLPQRWIDSPVHVRMHIAPMGWPRMGLHRFKVDPVRRLILFSEGAGAFVAVNLRTCTPYWQLVGNVHLTWPHVELSEGYLVVAVNGHFDIYRHGSITSPPARISTPPPYSPYTSRSSRYGLFCRITPTNAPGRDGPIECRATKLRFPFLFAADIAGTVYQWDLRTGEQRIVYMMTEDEWEEVRYLDFDDHFLFVCTPCVLRVIHWSNLTEEDNVHDYYPLAYLFGGMNAGFDAVHGDGTTTVLSNDIGQLRVYFSENGPGSTPIFKLGLSLNRFIVQIAFENDRIAYIAMDKCGNCSLWVLNLEYSPYPNRQLLTTPPPTPICIAEKMACLSAPGRLEMTCDSIITTCNSLLVKPSSSTLDALSSHPVDLIPIEHIWCTESELTSSVDCAPRLTPQVQQGIERGARAYVLDSIIIYSYVKVEPDLVEGWLRESEI